jgi:hypothetical protein
MLDIKVTTIGDKFVIDTLNQLGGGMQLVVQRGLQKVVRGVHPRAMEFLNGPGRSQAKLVQRNKTLKDLNRRNLRGQSDSLGARPGAYPVPVLTGNLKRLLDFLDPGQSKSSNGSSFAAGPLEAVLFDSAGYGSVILEGTFSSSKFGPRDFLMDGLARFNGEAGVAQTIETEYATELQRRGLA